MKLLWILAALISLSLVFAGQVPKNTLRPGDDVRLTCEQEPSLNRQYTITSDGFIVLPFIGAQSVVGQSEESASEKLSRALIAFGVISDGTVTLKRVGASSRPIGYSGAVRKPGVIKWRKGMRLSDVMKVAQPTESADLERVQLTPGSGQELVVNYQEGASKLKNPTLRPGDTIFLPMLKKPKRLTILGEVVKPGEYVFSDAMTLEDALERAGGTTPHSVITEIQIEHEGGLKEKVSLPQGRNKQLVAGDIVTVPQVKNPQFISVEGAVLKPGRFAYATGMTISQAIRKAGGPLARADSKAAKVFRMTDGRRRQINCDYAAIEKGLSIDLTLLGGDTVEIPFRKSK